MFYLVGNYYNGAYGEGTTGPYRLIKAKNKLRLDFIELDAEISIGDMLYTSGLGSIYTSSIPVAKIVEVKSKKNDINRYAVAEPCVDIKAIKEVAVIIN